MKYFLLALALFLSPSIYPMLELSMGQVGNKDTVYAALMEDISGFENQQFFGPGLQEAVDRALDAAKIELISLTDDDWSKINVFDLYSFNEASKKLKKSMKNHKRKLQKQGLWIEPEAPKIDEKDQTISKLTCCGNYLHQRCLKPYLRMSAECFLCKKTASDGFEHRPSSKHNFEGNCPICQEELPNEKDRSRDRSVRRRID